MVQEVDEQLATLGILARPHRQRRQDLGPKTWRQAFEMFQWAAVLPHPTMDAQVELKLSRFELKVGWERRVDALQRGTTTNRFHQPTCSERAWRQ